MIPKIIGSGSQDFGAPQVTILPMHSRGFDDHYLRKVADENGGIAFEKEIAEMKPIPGHTVIHVLAVGDEERFGPNRNTDGFSREDNKKCHHRFKTEGHVYKNHDSGADPKRPGYTDPLKKTGEVVATAHNDLMDRIELLAALRNDKYAEELDGLEKGHDIQVSMGSMQEYDVCSFCKHKAPTSKQHCEHIKKHAGEVTADGRKIYMQNPNPHYMDLSTVFKGADRIGYTLRKVALECEPLPGYVLAEQYGMAAMSQPKVAMMQRLAAIEKLCPAQARIVSTSPSSLLKSTKTKLKKAVEIHGVDAVLDALHKQAYLLSPADFAEVLIGTDALVKEAAAVPELLTNGFQSLIGDPLTVDSLDGKKPSYEFKLASDIEQDLRDSCSMQAGPVIRRALVQGIVGGPLSKQAAVNHDPIAAAGLAALYLRYKLAFASHPDIRTDESVLQAVAKSNILSA